MSRRTDPERDGHFAPLTALLRCAKCPSPPGPVRRVAAVVTWGFAEVGLLRETHDIRRAGWAHGRIWLPPRLHIPVQTWRRGPSMARSTRDSAMRRALVK